MCDIMRSWGDGHFWHFYLSKVVRRKEFWMKMRGHRVQEEFVDVCKGLYDGVEVSVCY